MIHPSAGITGGGSHTLWTVLLAWNKDKNIIFVGGWWGVTWQIFLFPCLALTQTAWPHISGFVHPTGLDSPRGLNLLRTHTWH